MFQPAKDTQKGQNLKVFQFIYVHFQNVYILVFAAGKTKKVKNIESFNVLAFVLYQLLCSFDARLLDISFPQAAHFVRSKECKRYWK